MSEYLPVSLDKLVLSSQELLPIERVVRIARDAARGLQGLHEVPGGAVVHFDLKPHQLMLGVNGIAKINDLNMCRFTGIDDDGDTCPFTESHASRPGTYVCMSYLVHVIPGICYVCCVCTHVFMCHVCPYV